MKLTYAVVIEQTPNNYAAYAPDMPGCISTAKTWDEMLAMIREALTVHIEFLIEDGDPVPEPTMSIDDAIAHHSEALAASDEESLADIRRPGPHDLDFVPPGRDRGSRPATRDRLGSRSTSTPRRASGGALSQKAPAPGPAPFVRRGGRGGGSLQRNEVTSPYCVRFILVP